jgi:hypothetical protein
MLATNKPSGTTKKRPNFSESPGAQLSINVLISSVASKVPIIEALYPCVGKLQFFFIKYYVTNRGFMPILR